MITDVAHQKATSTVIRVTGFLSMIGCGYVMYEVIADKKKRQSTYFRLMFGMSFIEFCDALAYVLGPWAVPVDDYIPWWGTAGNHASCMFQALLMQAAVGSSLYNAALAIYYLLSIRYNWSERLLSRKVEPWMHGICLVLGYGMAIAGLFLGIYGSMGGLCYIARYPPDCKETYKFGYSDCIYGDNSSLFHILFYEIWLWIAICISAVAMCSVWSSVRNQENRNARYSQPFQIVANAESNNNDGRQKSGSSSRNVDRKYSRRFAVQGALYVLVFYLCHMFSTFGFAIYHATGEWNLTLVAVASIFDPLEGFLNFLVYMRPRWIRYWKESKKGRESDGRGQSQSITSERSSSFLQSVLYRFSKRKLTAAGESVEKFKEQTPPAANGSSSDASTGDNNSGNDNLNTDNSGGNGTVANLRDEERDQIRLDAY